MKITDNLTKCNFKAGRTSPIKYIVIHYVGATGSAKANCEYYKTEGVGSSAHYFVDFDGSVYRSVRDEDTAWHCGASKYVHPECRNANAIGIEMCVRNKGSKANTSKDWYFEDATVSSAIELTKELMHKYNIDADHVIRHHDVTGKICPNPYVYNHTKHTWADFKAAISTPGGDWVKDGGKWYFKLADGTFVKNAWRLVKHHWYYLGRDGVMLTGWHTIDGEWFYLEESGDYEGACWHESEKKNGSLERWFVE